MGSALPAGRRASSPSPRPNSPVNRPFQPSSSQHSGLTTTSLNSKPAGRFSDAFTSVGSRTRTLSTGSDSKKLVPPRAGKAVAQDESINESSFGIDADPFASHTGGSVTNISQLAAEPSSSISPTTNILPHRKHRGSILFAASDALGFGRVGASISKRMNKRSSVEQTISPPVPSSQSPAQSQHRRGLPWKSKTKVKGHWALQPSPSSHIISDVIEISAAKAGSISIRDEEEENERRERDRLREAAAESIGISPLFREDASSRFTESDGMHFEDDSTDDIGSRNCHEADVEIDGAERMRALDRSRTSVNGTLKPTAVTTAPQQQQTRESRHNRSLSLSGLTTPTTPNSSSNWPLPPLGPPNISANGRTPKSSLPASFVQAEVPPFPCSLSALDLVSSKSSSLLKFFPSSPLLILGFSRQWRTRFIVLTAPPQPKSPTSSSFRPFTPPERTHSVCHLHLFKSSATDERELERLEVNENSVVFVAEEEIAGRRSVVKVGGMDVGGRKKELNVEENGQTMWLLSINDTNEAQSWIATLKSAVFDQRAEKAGFGMPTHQSATVSGPKGDLDVMLSMRAQDVASTVRAHTHSSSRTLHEDSHARSTDSPTPTMRSWSGEGRSSSPSSRMVSLKGFFSVPGRTRSMSHGTNQSDEDSPTTPGEPPSFTSRGATLLNMIRASSGPNAPATVEADSKSAPSSPVAVSQALPIPNLLTGPIMATSEMNLDRMSFKERDRELPEWYSIQNRQHHKSDSSSSVNVGPPLLPPPRSRRPWTSAGLLTSNAKRDQSSDMISPSRRSFQSTVSLHGARLSLDGKPRPSSPADSFGAATGAFGSPELASKRASLSSSVSSFSPSPSDRDQVSGRSSSSIQHRIRSGKIPKMLTPPAHPPPSVPVGQAQPRISSSSGERTQSLLSDHPPSRSSSLRSTTNSDVMQNGTMSSNRRLSTSSSLSVGSAGTPQMRGNQYNSLRQSSNTLSPKRASMPPPPRPAPTFALPPTPSEADNSKQNRAQNGTSPRRASFRESFSHRSLRFSLSPPPLKDTPSRIDDPSRRRSYSNGSSVPSVISSHTSSLANIAVAPPAPPPTGPLPPTPQDPLSNRYSLRERLRMKSAPSTPPTGMFRGGPPTTLPGAPPLVTVSSVASLKEGTPPLPIGEPITAIPSDLNFLNMSSPIEPSAPNEEPNFLNISTPITATFPKQIPGRSSDYPPPEHSNGSPPTPEMTVLPPPPRRSRAGTVSEKDRNHSAQSLSNKGQSMVDGIMPISIPLETVATV